MLLGIFAKGQGYLFIFYFHEANQRHNSLSMKGCHRRGESLWKGCRLADPTCIGFATTKRIGESCCRRRRLEGISSKVFGRSFGGSALHQSN